MYVFDSVCTFFLKTLPSGPPPVQRYKWGTGSRLVTRSGVFEIPVGLTRTQSPGSVSIIHLFKSTLKVLYMYIRRMSSEYLRALQTSFYGVGLSPQQYTVWNVERGAHALLEGYLSVGAAVCDALHCQRWEVYYLKLVLTLKEPNNRQTPLGILGWYL